jgi:2-keto-3-deoxy-L-rhamnonate aldolase RhmA
MLRGGVTAIGTNLTINNLNALDLVGLIGFYLAFVDTEHNRFEIDSVQALMQVISLSRSVPIVRVPWNDMVLIKRALEIGCFSVSRSRRTRPFTTSKRLRPSKEGIDSLVVGPADLSLNMGTLYKDDNPRLNEEDAV